MTTDLYNLGEGLLGDLDASLESDFLDPFA